MKPARHPGPQEGPTTLMHGPGCWYRQKRLLIDKAKLCLREKIWLGLTDRHKAFYLWKREREMNSLLESHAPVTMQCESNQRCQCFVRQLPHKEANRCQNSLASRFHWLRECKAMLVFQLSNVGSENKFCMFFSSTKLVWSALYKINLKHTSTTLYARKATLRLKMAYRST